MVRKSQKDLEMNTVFVMRNGDRGIRGRFFEAGDKGLTTRAEENRESRERLRKMRCLDSETARRRRVKEEAEFNLFNALELWKDIRSANVSCDDHFPLLDSVKRGREGDTTRSSHMCCEGAGGEQTCQ